MNEADQANQPITLEQALATAIALHQENQLEQAEAIYSFILDQFPDFPDALHFYGLLKHDQGNDDDAIKLIQKALDLAPEYSDAYNNLGNIFRLSGKFESAIECYRKTLDLNPNNISASNNLGILLKDMGRFDEAIESINNAIELMPNYPGFYRNIGNAYMNQGRFPEAIKSYRTALGLSDYNPEDYENLSRLLYMTRNFEEALPLVDQWLQHDPENPLALHKKAAYSGINLTKASNEYVSALFDGFAQSFDSVLKNLDYKAPFIVAEAIENIYGETKGTLSILDAGCGTGLCGPLIKDYASRLVGVDLSPKMLELAEKRNCYHDLIHSELVAMIDSNSACYDVIVSADTLVYFGELESVTRAAAKALLPGGHFIFTVESTEEELDQGFKINPHGRFSHTKHYIDRIIGGTSSLSVVDISPVLLRYEGGVQVDGYLVIAKSTN